MLQTMLAFITKPENLKNAALKKAVGWKSLLASVHELYLLKKIIKFFFA